MSFIDETTIETLFFGSGAFIGILIFIILGLVAQAKERYSGAFIFIIAMIYEWQFYERLDMYGNNIYYMIILIVYAIFSAWNVFRATGDD